MKFILKITALSALPLALFAEGLPEAYDLPEGYEDIVIELP